MRETGAQEIVVNPREQAGFEEADGSLVFDFFFKSNKSVCVARLYCSLGEAGYSDYSRKYVDVDTS